MSAKAEAETDSGDEEIGGVRVSSTGRVIFPDAGLTKGDVARHYARVAGRMLEHVADRPLSLLRCPDGIAEDCFFQKHAGKGFPEDIKAVPIKEKDGGTEDYMYVTTPEGLIGAAQMGAVEYHVWGAKRDKLERPDRMVFDLDPDEGLGFEEVKRAAAEVREGLKACGLEAAPMVTGGGGAGGGIMTPDAAASSTPYESNAFDPAAPFSAASAAPPAAAAAAPQVVQLEQETAALQAGESVLPTAADAPIAGEWATTDGAEVDLADLFLGISVEGDASKGAAVGDPTQAL